MSVLRLLAMIAASMIAVTAHAQTGVVLLHGKWGTPEGPTRPLEVALRGAGFRVIARDMPWSDTRAYDKDLDGAMAEIDAQMAELRAAGVMHLVVAGQSLGANMALAYAARHPELDGVVAISPGHAPERMRRNSEIAEDLQRARAMLSSGRGGSYLNFEDINQGRTRQVSAKPAVFISYFDPDGGAVMPRNAARLSPHTALLWVVGRHDRMSDAGPGYAFDRAPKNPLSAYRVVEADHFSAPMVSRQVVVDWLKELR
ncbi:MAG TPA: alpha/beta fold hydrolase [Reyranella sp.]|jgi:pimeloyl-ACP methyl ester carboxylesterase|nr:alpha/beta fold hydrolase [Reyranella sp.]